MQRLHDTRPCVAFAARGAGPPQAARLTFLRCKRRNAALTHSTDSTDAFCIGYK